MTERRNLYRLLYVQPEAPTEVIKAAHRALMLKLRIHPDLGGDTDTAARLNAAVAILTDPAQRKAYDQSLRGKGRTPANPAATANTTATTTANAAATAATRAAAHDIKPAVFKPLPPAWLAERRCPFCHTPFALLPKPGARCGHCASPLTPVPKPPKPPKAANTGAVTVTATGEPLGRRNGEQRFPRDTPVSLRMPGDVRHHVGRLRDLSFTGLSFHAAIAPPKGSTFRVATDMFDAVAQVVTLRRQGEHCTVHAVLLTLELQRTSRGVYVNAQA